MNVEHLVRLTSRNTAVASDVRLTPLRLHVTFLKRPNVDMRLSKLLRQAVAPKHFDARARQLFEGKLMRVLHLLAVSLTLFALQFSASGVLQAQTLKVPYVSLSPTAGPLWIAYEAGYFKKNNVSTELLYIPGGSTIIQAIISGDVKVANMAPPSAIGAWAKGFDLTLIASGVDQLLETVVTGPSVRTVADLKNKKIGVSRFGSLTDMALRKPCGCTNSTRIKT